SLGAAVRAGRHSDAILIYFYGLAFERRSPPPHVRVIPLLTAEPKLIPMLLCPTLRCIVRDCLSRAPLSDELCSGCCKHTRYLEDPASDQLETHEDKKGVQHENGDRSIEGPHNT